MLCLCFPSKTKRILCAKLEKLSPAIKLLKKKDIPMIFSLSTIYRIWLLGRYDWDSQASQNEIYLKFVMASQGESKGLLLIYIDFGFAITRCLISVVTAQFSQMFIMSFHELETLV